MLFGLYGKNKKSDTNNLDTYEQRQTSDDFCESRRTLKNSKNESKIVTWPISVSKNPFDLFKHKKLNTIHFDTVNDSNDPYNDNKNPLIISDSNITKIQNHVKIQNNLEKRLLSS